MSQLKEYEHVLSSKHDSKADKEPALNGTFAAVLLLGTFLAISWLAVFLLFLYRQ